MKVTPSAIPEVRIIEPARHGDERGLLSETYNRAAFKAAGIDLDFMQDNHVLTRAKGTVRGLHFQAPPAAQDKLVRVVRGAILDVAVDLRAGSATYGHHVAHTLSAENWLQVLVPVGFAHGYCTLEPDSEIIYKVTSAYAPEHDRGLAWNDPALAIPWPVAAADAILVERDRRHPRLDEIDTPFR